MSEQLTALLKKQEGYRKEPYLCTEGYWTVGYGRNLETNGIDEEEAEYLLKRDIARCRSELTEAIVFFSALDTVRQDALINMAFQMGVVGLMKFKNMLYHLSYGNYEKSAEEALDSRWAKQTPVRARQVAELIRTGEYYV